MTFGADFPNLRRLVELIGELEGFDFTSLFHRLSARDQAALKRATYWEEPDYLFMAVVKEIVDSEHFTFVWRGRILWARGIPDTSDLTVGESALIRKLPASREYFHISIAKYLIVWLRDTSLPLGGTGAHKIVYTTNLAGANTVWTVAPYNTQDVGRPRSLSVDKSSNRLWLTQNPVGALIPNAITRVDDFRTGGQTGVLTKTIIENITGITSTDWRTSGKVHSVATKPGFIIQWLQDFITERHWIFRSSDYGDTWSATEITGLMGNSSFADSPTFPFYDWNLLILYENPTTIIGIGYSGDSPGATRVIASYNSGVTFQVISDSSLDTIEQYPPDPGVYSENLMIRYPRFYLHNDGVLASINQGITWDEIQIADFLGLSFRDIQRIVTSDGLKVVLLHHVNGRFALTVDGWNNYSTYDLGYAIQDPHITVWRNGLYVTAGNYLPNPPAVLRIQTIDDAFNVVNCNGDIFTKLGSELYLGSARWLAREITTTHWPEP